MLKLIVFCGLTAIVPISLSYSQMTNNTFERISKKEGLSQSTVNGIIQDKKGFMWFATFDGINKYDGYTFKVYRNIANDRTSLSQNGSLYLYEDQEGYIWVTNNGNDGLNKFDPETEKFTRYRYDPEDSASISSNEVFHIMQDKSGNIWICTRNALNLAVNRKVGHSTITGFKRFYTAAGVRPITMSYEDRNGNLLLFADSLFYFDKRTNTIQKTNTPLRQARIMSIGEDASGSLWLGTEDKGIVKLAYDKKMKSYVNVPIGKINVTPNNRNFVLIDDKDRIWIATESKGLYRYNEKEGSLINFISDENDMNSISDNTIFSLYVDRSGILWIGTFSKGLCKYNLNRKQFLHFKSIPGNKNSLSKDVISSIHSTKPGELWVGNDLDGGVNRLIFKSSTEFKVVHYKFDPKKNNTIGSNSIFCLVQRRNGEVWVGSSGGYISKIIPEKPGANELPILQTYRHHYWPFAIYEDRDGIIWVGTWGRGLWKFKYRIDTAAYSMHDPNNPSSLCDNIVWSISEDNSGNLWIGGHGEGISILPAKEKNKPNPKFINYRHEEGNSKSLSNNTVHVFCQDHAGTMWIGTSNGLNKVIIKDNNLKDIGIDDKLEFVSYYMKDGLPNENIVGIVEDNGGNLWLSTSNGLSKFNIEKESAVNYDELEGLQSNEYWHNAYFKDQNGRIYFGGQNGFNAFNPDSIKDNPYVPNVVITDLLIFNKPAEISASDSPLKKHISLTDKIVLNYGMSVFSFKYTALNYVLPGKNQYAYMMEGFEKNWNYVGNKREATYTNLDPGEYIFRVKASNNDGIWNERGTAIIITITPPYWQTLWFRLITLIALAGIAVWIYRWRIQARDLAAQRRLDEELGKERNLLRTLIDNWPDYIYIKDLAGRFIVGNKAFMRRFGFSSEAELIGRTDFDLFPPENAQKFYESEKRIIQSDKGIFDSEGSAVDPTKEDKNIWVSTTKIPLHDAQGKIVGIVGIGRDVTSRKKSEAEREQLIVDLQTALNDIKTLSGLVPICANCKKIRDDKGYWTQLEAYIQDRSDARFSHSICPDCASKLYPNYNLKKQ